MALTPVQAGDLVRHENKDRVVVDVTDDGLAVLRAPDDLRLLDPACVPADSLEVTGHVDSVPGWAEDALGQWRKS